MKTPSKSRRQKQLTKTAYHEAGHAVALWELKFKIKKATIVPKGNTAGGVSHGHVHLGRLEGETPPIGKRLSRIHDSLVVAFAGEEAQRRFDPRSLRRDELAGDREWSSKLLALLHGDNGDNGREVFYAGQYLRTRARNLVNRNWRQVEDLAKALLERKTLSGQEAQEVLQASLVQEIEENVEALPDA